MSNSNTVGQAPMITSFQLDCQRSEEGWWFVSAEIGRNGIGGLVVSEATLPDALQKACQALADLEKATITEEAIRSRRVKTLMRVVDYAHRLHATKHLSDAGLTEILEAVDSDWPK